MDRNHVQGFTLIELLVAMAVLAILLGIGIPSFASAIKNSCMSSNHNALVGSLYLARSEAVKSSSSVTVCPRTSSTSEVCGTVWENGWLVFVDRARTSNETTATVNAADEIISVEGAVCGNGKVRGFGSSDRTAAGKSDRNFIRYTANGSSDWNNGSFVICDDRGAASAHAINIALTGDIRRGRPANDESEVPLDAFRQAVTCSTTP